MNPRKSSTPSLSTTLYSWVPSFPGTAASRFPKAARLKSSIMGNGSRIFSPDGSGTGFGNLISDMGKASQDNPEGLCFTSMTPITGALLVNNPKLIEFLHENRDKFLQHDDTGAFEFLLKMRTILALEVDTPEYKKARGLYNHGFLSLTALSFDTRDMQEVGQRTVERLREKNIEYIEDLCAHDALEKILIKLNCFKPIEPNVVTKLNYLLKAATAEVMSFYVLTALKIFPKALAKPYIESSRAWLLIQEARDIIREHIVKPNREDIVKPGSWFNKDSKLNFDSSIENIIDAIQEVLFVGMDTSSTAFNCVLRLLGNPDPEHKRVLNKLREEIQKKKAELGRPPSEWTREEIFSLKYLEHVWNESLRVFPPLPDLLPHKVTDKLVIPGIGTLWPGELLLFSARATHSNKKLWGKDADKFRPERFEELGDKDISYQFFPTGLKPKDCPGQLFARLSVSISVLAILDKFKNFEFVDKTSLNLFFADNDQQVISGRFKDPNLRMKFTPRGPKPTVAVEPLEEKHGHEQTQSRAFRLGATGSD